jgi:hypothetical protein
MPENHPLSPIGKEYCDDCLSSIIRIMMLALYNLRNVNVYDQIEIGSKEKLVASAAWEIVSDGWKDQD